MEDETSKLIEKLIGELKVNDEKVASEYEEPPEEPREAMGALTKIGQQSVEPLLELLKDASKYSCLYAIKVLGEIRDSRAVEPIIKTFSSEEFAETFTVADEYEQPISALQRIGLPALEPTLRYLKETVEKDDEIGMCNALEILGGIKDEKSFWALVDMLSHPNGEVAYTATMMLGEYGDKRAVEYLKKLLENVDARDSVIKAIRKLVPTREYRDIIAPYALEYLDQSRKRIDKCLRDIEIAMHKYPSLFEGDDAEELNAIAQEKVREPVEDLLRITVELAVYEAVISVEMYEKLDKMICELSKKRWKIEEKYREEMHIINGYIPEPVLKEEEKSYKGLAPETGGDEHPKLETLQTKIWNWLKKQDSRVVRKNVHLYARMDTTNGRKGCYVAVAKDYERPRTWGLVHLILWGEGWIKEEIEAFTETFWQHVESVVKELVGKICHSPSSM